MATTVTYTFIERCTAGGHFAVNIEVGSNDLGRYQYETDEIRAPLANLDQQTREQVALAIIKLHFQGKTRAEMNAEFMAGPVVITI